MVQNAGMGSPFPAALPMARAPELVPMLSRGKHRHPRQGACFMELASFVAGERWSDHPACTHPLLASLARLVNDATTDAARHQLAALIPNVIGLTSDDPRIDVRIALRSATAALPVAAAQRQKAMAVAVIVANRLLDELDDLAGRPADRLEEESRWALAHVPGDARWAEQFTDLCPATVAGFRRYGAPSIVRNAVEGIAHACIPDPDLLLRDLLRTSIEDCAARIHGENGTGSRSPSPAAGDARTDRIRDRPRLARLSRR
jgi:hypothetical protein